MFRFTTLRTLRPAVDLRRSLADCSGLKHILIGGSTPPWLVCFHHYLFLPLNLSGLGGLGRH